MDAITTRTAERRAIQRRSGGAARLVRRLSALANAAAERLTSPQRDVPPEFYLFPPF